MDEGRFLLGMQNGNVHLTPNGMRPKFYHSAPSTAHGEVARRSRRSDRTTQDTRVRSL